MELVVPETGEGLRLDQFLATAAPELTRTRAQRLIHSGMVLLEGQLTRPSRRVRAGERVRVTLPDPKPAAARPEDLPLDVLYEDEHILVVNKPRDMPVHPAPGHPTGTLVNALLRRYGDFQVGDRLRPGIVHRLDKDTTGVLVVARNDAALLNLQRQIKNRTVKRLYLALVRGTPPAAGTVDAPIGRHPGSRTRMAVVADGRPAVTHYRRLEVFDRYSLLEVQLETGRTHQIRVHLAHIGHPVAGDVIYGGRRGTRGELGLEGQALHARRLEFTHPATGERMAFEAPPPPDFLAALALLRSTRQVGARTGPVPLTGDERLWYARTE
ncbi:MAG: RluA family pseudouridine synthase [Clostridia bacterium]|nr:RluA family pseudouridine synthase [Clostridia bacterium]